MLRQLAARFRTASSATTATAVAAGARQVRFACLELPAMLCLHHPFSLLLNRASGSRVVQHLSHIHISATKEGKTLQGKGKQANCAACILLHYRVQIRTISAVLLLHAHDSSSSSMRACASHSLSDVSVLYTFQFCCSSRDFFLRCPLSSVLGNIS